MKKIILKTLVVAAVLSSAVAAKAQGWNGDLLLGLTIGSGHDIVVDLEPFGSLANNQQFNLNSALSAAGITLGQLSTAQWGIVGDDAASTVYITTPGAAPGKLAAQGNFNPIDNALVSIGANFAAGAGSGSFLTPLTTGQNSWFAQTVSPSLTTQYRNVYQNPNGTGLSSVTLWSTICNNSAPTVDGFFTLNSSGIATFTTSLAVPEPSTYGLVAGAGLLLISLRRKLSANA